MPIMIVEVGNEFSGNRSPVGKNRGVLKVGPIRDDSHYQRLTERLDVLVEMAAAEVRSRLWDLVELIGDRLREYETRAHCWGEAEPVEALRYLMQAHGLTQSALPEVGNQAVKDQSVGKRTRCAWSP